MRRPDLSNVPPDVLRYIEYLEQRSSLAESTSAESLNTAPFPAEPASSRGIITISAAGAAKRTYRHLYTRQHRGGMGVLDLDIDLPDAPSLLAVAEENQMLLLLTNLARVFRFPVRQLEPQPIRAPGTKPFERLGLEKDERFVAALPEQAQGYVTLVSAIGKVRSFRHHVFGEHMRPGTSLYNLAEFGALAAASWTPGDGDLFIVTRKGVGIRFSEKSVPPAGAIGLRVAEGDEVIGVCPVTDESPVFLLGADGKGTLRLMSGFAPNKSPGGGGKIAFRNGEVVGAATVTGIEDVVAITQGAKVLRFPIAEVPASEAPVQGVNCVGMRLDQVNTFCVI